MGDNKTAARRATWLKLTGLLPPDERPPATAIEEEEPTPDRPIIGVNSASAFRVIRGEGRRIVRKEIREDHRIFTDIDDV